VAVPEDLSARCGFVLYPYVSTDFNAPEAITYDFRQAELPAVQRDRTRTDRELIAAWDAAQRGLAHAWSLGLDPGEEAAVLDLIDQDEPELDDAPARVGTVYAAEMRCRQAYQALQNLEERKIEHALDNLYACASPQ
jgi:hypothetical protein